MLKKLFKFKIDPQMLTLIGVVIILLVIFYPRTTPLFKAGVSAYVGNLGGKVDFEAFDGVENFETSNDKSFVLFYAPWCKFCKQVAPEWAKLEKENTTDIKIVKVNCEENPELAQRHGIKGFPTILFLSKGLGDPSARIEYKGERKGESFLAFIAKQ